MLRHKNNIAQRNNFLTSTVLRFACVLLFTTHYQVALADTINNIVILVDRNAKAASELADTVSKTLAGAEKTSGTTLHIINSNSTTDLSKIKASELETDSTLLLTIGSQSTTQKFAALPNFRSLSLLVTPGQFEQLSQQHYDSVDAALDDGNSAILLEPAIKQYLSLGKSLLPKASKVGFVFGNASESRQQQIVDISRSLDLDADLLLLNKKDNPIRKLTPIVKQNDFVIVLPDDRQFNRAVSKWLLQLSLRYRKPVIAFSDSYAKAGASAAAYATFDDIAKQACEAVEDIIASDKPSGRLYKQQYYSTTINQSVIRAIGIAAPSPDE